MAAHLSLPQPELQWSKLPPLPDPTGFAGCFAGTSGGMLIVAGGANFPGKMPWEGGRKIWYDTAFLLDKANGHWQASGKLPRPLGYGVSITTSEGLICIGGSDATQHVRDVFLLSCSKEGLKMRSLPPLPAPLANACGALVGDSIYIAGGTAAPDSTNTMRNFWALDLRQSSLVWTELEPWNGPGRMLSVAASVGGSFFLVGGTSLAPDSTGNPVRTYLKDAYRFTPGHGWTRVADMPNPVVAAPTPAPVVDRCSFLIIGGDDGTLAGFEPKSRHPGFPNRVLSYDTLQDRWSVVGTVPASRATLPIASWNGLFVLPNGESKPGVRSPDVWALSVRHQS